MNDEFILYETKETQDREYSWGEVTSETYSYRFVLLVKDGNVTTEYQSGAIRNNEEVEYEECDAFDIDFKDLDWSEIQRLESSLTDLNFNKAINTIQKAKENIERLIPTK